MPIIVTFDIAKGNVSDYGRVQSFFERFGWENLGGTAYRYPPLGIEDSTEDWFNRVIPALMLLREALLKAKMNKRRLYRFTLDVQSSTGYVYKKYGKPPVSSKNIRLEKPSNLQFGEKNLRDWLTAVEYPY
jgi:hypothetical protein